MTRSACFAPLVALVVTGSAVLADDAPRRKHWAFQPIHKPAVPYVRDASWAKTPLDRFVLVQLEAGGLAPSRRADRQTLIRRASFDLLGLPPSPEAIAAFEADTSPGAFARLVDRLLASPHYGERWGRHWLDVARYADHKGYTFFGERTYPWAWTYRDYVVRAFNDDLPFDRFVLHQLAADRLDLGDDQRPLTALGFLTLGERFMENVQDIIDDRIDVVTRGLLGLTVTCARCHDHKFDAITQADYYGLYGVFRGSVEPALPPLFERPPPTEAYRRFDAELQRRLDKLVDFVTSRHTELVTSARSRAADYLLAAHAQRNQPPTDEFMLLSDQGALNPTMVLRWRILLEQSSGQSDPVWSLWHALAKLAVEDFAQRAADVSPRLVAQRDAAHPINPLLRQAFAGSPPKSMADVASRYAALLNHVEQTWRAALRQAETTNRPAPTTLGDPAAEQLRRIFHGPNAPPDVPLLVGWGFLALFPDRPTQEDYKKLLKAVEEHCTQDPASPPRAMVLLDAPQPYHPRVFLRGNPHRLGEPVARRFLEVLVPDRRPFVAGSGRLELAKAIVDPANPLTARVFVNRVWRHHFGGGLVETPSDFGVQGEPPSHPQLLDWLAATFVEEGWSIKRLHRHMLLSATWQQASDGLAASTQADPANRLFCRANRRPLDFEAIRDALLAVSGNLDRTLGGPPIDAFASTFVARRSLYGFLDRMNLPHVLRTFDFPSPLLTSPKRDATIVAPQALFLMNHPFVAEVARRAALRDDVTARPTSDARVERLYAVLFGRGPSDDERQLAREYLGEKPSPDDWAKLIHALLMSNEFVYVD